MCTCPSKAPHTRAIAVGSVSVGNPGAYVGPRLCAAQAAQKALRLPNMADRYPTVRRDYDAKFATQKDWAYAESGAVDRALSWSGASRTLYTIPLKYVWNKVHVHVDFRRIGYWAHLKLLLDTLQRLDEMCDPSLRAFLSQADRDLVNRIMKGYRWPLLYVGPLTWNNTLKNHKLKLFLCEGFTYQDPPRTLTYIMNYDRDKVLSEIGPLTETVEIDAIGQRNSSYDIPKDSDAQVTFFFGYEERQDVYGLSDLFKSY